MTGQVPSALPVFVLAAGRGTRLAPLTDRLPKPLVRLGGIPILEHNIRSLAAAGYQDLIVNVHHLPDQVTWYFGDGSPWGVRLAYSYEPVLQGTAGALKAQESRLRASTFVVLYGDNLFQCDLVAPVVAHQASGATLTVTWVTRPDPGASGVLCMDSTGRLVDFVEKPGASVPGPAPISAGLLVAEPRVLDFVPPDVPSDLAGDVIPALLESGEPVHGVPLDGRILWIDTPGDLEKAQAQLGAS